MRFFSRENFFSITVAPFIFSFIVLALPKPRRKQVWCSLMLCHVVPPRREILLVILLAIFLTIEELDWQLHYVLHLCGLHHIN
jgi:hypothetical protein